MRRTLHALILAGLTSCAGADGTPDGGGGGGGGGGNCMNKVGLTVSVEADGGRDPVGRFNADYFVSSYLWVRVPNGSQPGEPCDTISSDDLLKRVVVSSPNILAGKIASGSVSYRSLPVPPQGSEYCWSSTTGALSCPSADAGTEIADSPPALNAGQYQLIFFEPGIPHAQETGRATFTLSN